MTVAESEAHVDVRAHTGFYDLIARLVKGNDINILEKGENKSSSHDVDKDVSVTHIQKMMNAVGVLLTHFQQK